MNGVLFGDIHSYDDLSLILKSKEIQSPKPKTDTLDIPGADGEEDLTEYFGSVKYKNRKLTFNFSTIVPMKDFLELFSTVQNAVHGKKMRIILDDDPEFYYVGRLTCDKWKANKRIGTIKIEGNCEPYKYKLYKTVINEVIGGSSCGNCVQKSEKKRCANLHCECCHADHFQGGKLCSQSRNVSDPGN